MNFLGQSSMRTLRKNSQDREGKGEILFLNLVALDRIGAARRTLHLFFCVICGFNSCQFPFGRLRAGGVNLWQRTVDFSVFSVFSFDLAQDAVCG